MTGDAHPLLLQDPGAYIKAHIRTVPDWPEKGVMFRDITPLLANPRVFRVLIDQFVHRYFSPRPDAIAGLDARGFIIGSVVAYELGASLGRFTPSFVHGVEFQALGKDLIGVGSRDWYGATLAMQWFSLDPPLVGPVFMLADRNDGSETPNAAATAHSDALLEVTPPTGDEELTLSFAEAGRALRLDVGPRSSVLQAPPWGERLRQRLREAVREHLRAAGTPGAAGS